MAEGSRDVRGYWRENIRVLVVLLSIWFAVSFGLGILLVEPLNAFSLGGFPLGFWFAQQGAIYVFVALIFVYARWMGPRRPPLRSRLEARMGIQSWTYLIVGLTFALYIGIAIWSRVRSTSEFYVAGQGVPAIANGMATGADWMSAASFISAWRG